MRNERLKQAKSLIQQGPTGKFRWQLTPKGEHACGTPATFLAPGLPQVRTQLRSESKLPNLYQKSYPGYSCKRVGPRLLSRMPPSARSQHTKLLPPKTFAPKPHLVEVVLFQEFAEQACRKYLILQPLQAILPNALCDDPVQLRGADFIRNGPQEPNVPGFLADKAKSQAPVAIWLATTTFQRTTGKCD